MKAERLNSVTRALLKKQWTEKIYPYKRGNFDVVGFFLKLLIAAALIAVFVIFFGKFIDIYKIIMTKNQPDVSSRAHELLTLVYGVIILFMTVGAVSAVNRELFAADDIKIFSAMPVGARPVFISKIISIYISQLVVATVMILTVNVTVALHTGQGGAFYAVTVLSCFITPLLTIALGSVLALPFRYLKKLLDGKYIVIFVLITAVAGVLFYLYSIILGAVKDLLLGESLKYFFNEARMNAIGRAVKYMYPSKWLADLAVGRNVAAASVGISVLIVVCAVVSMVIISGILRIALQSRFSGSVSYKGREKKISKPRGGFFALVKKEFLIIFRTPSYMFSYFSMALIMPLMVYFCMSVGSSMVVNLVGLDLNTELALFLTLLFGALTNVFCATNISRDGQMFYTVKALPLGCRKVMFSKIFLCMAVTAFSQLVSALLLAATGFVVWHVAAFLFFTGSLFGFVNICVATRYDFNHARFSTEEDGEIIESSNAISAIIVLGLVISAIVGGAVFLLRIGMLLRNVDLYWLSYLAAGGAAVISAVFAYIYFITGLDKKYYAFEGGAI